MKLSVLIPTYNADCTRLVNDLLEQLPEEAELIVGDDGSTDEQIRLKNLEIHEWPQCRYWESKENLGRAAIRNRLAELAQGEWLLYMDSDAQVQSDDFIGNYLSQTAENDVICGGTASPAVCPSPNVSLRWRYESRFWTKQTAEVRQKSAYESFTTFNFMIRREVFLSIKFNENIRQYGHEDTLFGQELKEHGVKILHINNPLVHMGLEPNAEFLAKTEIALRSLKAMPKQQRHCARIARFAEQFDKPILSSIIRLVHRILSRSERANLLGNNPNLTVFKLYKLGYYLTLS